MSKTHWTVKSKLSLAFGGLTVVILFVASLAIAELGMLHGKFEAYVEGAGARAHLAADVESAALRRAVAVRNMVLSNNPTERDAEKQRVLEAQADVQKHLELLLAMVKNASGEAVKERELIAGIARVEANYSVVAAKILAMAQEGRKEEAIASMSADCRPLLDQLIKAVVAYVDHSKGLAAAQVDETESGYKFDRSLLLAICAISLLFAGGAGYLITRNLMRTLGADPSVLGTAAARVAEGDLTTMQEAAVAPNGSVLALLGSMQSKLANVVGQVRSASDSIATGTAQIAAGNADLSQRTEEQASSLEQTAASMEELSSTVKNNADTTQQANQMATEASLAASRGGEVVGQVIGTMEEIAQSSKKIADIIGVIDGIAFQTNILALNAAVEAARAGEQGRGFAVVAGEVRTLAQRSANAAKEIKALINDSVTKVDMGTRQVNEAGESMAAIVSQVKHVSTLIGEISRATGEQTNGILQVSDAVNLLDQVTQQNAALVEESAAAADSLRQQTVKLQDVVATFKLGNEQMFNAAHSQQVVSRQAPSRPHISKAAQVARAKPKTIATATASASAVHAAAETEWDTF